MSATDPKFKLLLKAIDKSLDNMASKLSRKRKEARIQLVAINTKEIYNEITSKYSPFKVPGSEVPNSALSNIAKKIQADLWKLFKIHSTGKHFSIGQEREFLAYDGVALLFDDAQHFIYVRSSKGINNQEVFRSNAMQRVQVAVKSRPLNDPTSMFINVNPEYVTQKNKLNIELVKEFEKSPEYDIAKASPRKDAISKKLENIRGKRGDAFGKYPKNYWSQKFQKLFVDYPGQGTQLGHVFGGQVSIATNVVADRNKFLQADTYEDVVLLDSIPASFNQSKLKQGILKVSRSDANVVFKRSIVKNNVFGELTILVPELKDKNQKEGTAAQNDFKNFVVPELKKLRNSIAEIKGSPSYNELLTEYIENVFLGKNIRNKTYTTKAKIKRKPIAIRVNVLTIKSSQLKTRTVDRRIRRTKDGSLNLQDLMFFLNQKLHDKIQENMGKGGSKKVLNYRTGRFAKSAKIKQIIPGREKNTIIARVKYMRDPYGVFEPGRSKLSSPGRSPAKIFGRSIRQLLQEQKIATLRRVEVELRG